MQINKSKGYKFLIILFVFLGLVVPFMFGSCGVHEGYPNTNMEAQKYTMDAVIDENGDMHVKETIVIDNYTNFYNNYFYKEIAYNKNNMFGGKEENVAYLKEDVKVIVEDYRGVVYNSETSLNNYPTHFVGFSYENDRDERGYSLRCESTSTEYCDMIFYYNKPGFATITTFTYEYTIEGVITQYKDISEFNWVLLSYQPFEFNDVKINITLPSGDYNIANEDTFFHGTNMAKRDFVSNNKIVITTDNMLSDEQIEVRLLLDNELFAGVNESNKVNINAKNDILAFEENQIKEADKKFAIGNVWSSVVYGGFIVLMFIIAYIGYKKYDNEYYRELPAEYSPAVMGYLYKFRNIDDDDLTATLLDLIRRKYLILDANGTSGVNDKRPNYTIRLNKEKSQKDLTESEKYLIRWFIGEIGNGEEVTSKQLSSFGDDYENARKYQNSSKTWYKLVKSEASKYKFFEKSIHSKKNRCLVIGILLTIIFDAIFVYMWDYSGYFRVFTFIFGAIFIVLALAIYIQSIDKRSKKGNEDYVRWKAFKKFLEEFGSFEDYPVPSLIVWEHYLVYATSFGIADKVSEQLKLKFNLEQISSVDCTFVVYFGLGHRIGGFNSTVRDIRTMSHSTMVRHTAQRAGSSFGGRSGGGGFSGGSSFGGGGGSFGGGRR